MNKSLINGAPLGMKSCCCAIIFMVHSIGFAQSPFKSTLHQLIEVYPPVASARSQVQSATAEMDSANWNFYPTPSVAYERGDKKVVGALNQDMRYLRLQQPIWTAGRLTAQQNKAESQYRQAKSALEEQRLSAAFRWLQLWAEYQGANLKIAAYEEGEKKHLDYVRRIEKRALEGYSASSDLELSQSRLASVRGELRQYVALQQQARNRLEQMLGRPLSDERALQAGADWLAKPDQPVGWQDQLNNEALSQIAETHPSIQKFLTLIEVAEADMAVTKARNVPEVYLRGEVRKGDITGTDRSVYIGLNSSFGAGLSNMSAAAAAQSRVDAARNDVAAKRLDILETIQTELQTYQAQRDRIGHLEKTLEGNKNYLQSSERQFLAGRRTWQEVMNTAREEAQILVQIADAQAQIWLAQQRLHILRAGLDAYLLPTSTASTVR